MNFEAVLSREELLLGYNGSGKSSLIDSLSLIADIVDGKNADWIRDIPAELCLWLDSSLLELECDVSTATGNFAYRIVLDCNREKQLARILAEELKADGAILVRRDLDQVYLHRDDGSEGGTFPLDWTQSAVASVQPSAVNTKLQAFRSNVSSWVILRPNPLAVEPVSLNESMRPEVDLRNLPSWYRFLSQNGKWAREFHGLLSDVWDGFSHTTSVSFGKDAKGLDFVFNAPETRGKQIHVDWPKLSDGERAIVGLYSLVALARTKPDATFILDEPDNFLAVSEVGPWLTEMLDSIGESGQMILVSHHPNVIRQFGESRSWWLARARHDAPTTIRRPESLDDGLMLDERVQRGWMD